MSDETTNPVDLDSYSASVQSTNTVITLLALIHIVAGIITIPLVYSIFSTDIFQAPAIVTFLIIVEGSILALTIPVFFVLGWAIWRLQPWAWKVAVIVNIICLIFNIIGGIVLIAMLNIVLLFTLYGPDVRLAMAPMDT